MGTVDRVVRVYAQCLQNAIGKAKLCPNLYPPPPPFPRSPTNTRTHSRGPQPGARNQRRARNGLSAYGRAHCEGLLPP